MISLSDVSVHYGDQPVVQNISFDIRQGKVMVLIGPNGSGKRRLFAVLPAVLNFPAAKSSMTEKTRLI